MSAKPLLLVVLVSLVSAAGCGSPFVLLPGGELEGTPAAVPASWSFTDAVQTVQLETRPDEPYSVNIWVTAAGDALYVHAGANRSTWVEHIEADPNVRLRVGDSIYALAAARVEDQGEFDRFSDAYERKYGLRPRNENVAEVYLFRLTAREAAEPASPRSGIDGAAPSIDGAAPGQDDAAPGIDGAVPNLDGAAPGLDRAAPARSVKLADLAERWPSG